MKILRKLTLTLLSALLLSWPSSPSVSARPGDSAPLTLGEPRTVSTSLSESLYDVARREGFAIEHLAEANGLPVSLAPAGVTRLRLPTFRILPTEKPANGLVINICERGVYLFKEGKAPKFYPMAVGQPGRFATPTGRFSIIEKVKDPEWIAPEWAGLGEDNVVPAGPDNPLGDRWIGLTSSGLGMHGTNQPSSIGSATSHGCMRMYPEIIREVFDQVSVGWPVRIEYRTARVVALPDRVAYVRFPDIYSLGSTAEQLRSEFVDQDLAGFYRSELVTSPADGLVRSAVDMKGEVRAFDGSRSPLARVEGRSYLTGDALKASGVSVAPDLASRTALLTFGERRVTVPLGLSGETDLSSEHAFLSRGKLWLPARPHLPKLGIELGWDGAARRLDLILNPSSAPRLSETESGSGKGATNEQTPGGVEVVVPESPRPGRVVLPVVPGQILLPPPPEPAQEREGDTVRW